MCSCVFQCNLPPGEIGETLHRLFNVSPIDYSLEYDKVLSLKNNGIICVYIYIYIYRERERDEISMISEQMWNIIALEVIIIVTINKIIDK